LKEDRKVFESKLEDARNRKYLEAEAILCAKIEQVYQQCVMPNDAKLEPIDLLAELECQLLDLIETVDQQPREFVQQLLKKRIQRRNEDLRRSKMASRRPEEGCLRCQEKAKRKVSGKV